MDFLLLEGANIWDVYEKYYSDKINKHAFFYLATADPTAKCGHDVSSVQKGKYLPWIINAWISLPSEKNSSLDDIAKHIYTILEWYDKHRQLLPQEQQDILKLSYEQLTDIYDTGKDKYFTQKEIRGQADIVYNDDEWEIVIPKTWEASKIFGANTKWCTASKDSDYHFKNYTKEGPLYINIDKIQNKKWQFHPASESYFDEEDNDLLEGEVIEDESIADYAEIPGNVLDWYESHEHEIFEKITEPVEGNWYDYEIWNEATSEIIGYFKDGTLYDTYKEECGNYAYIAAIGRERIAMNNYNSDSIDVYDINDGNLSLIGEDMFEWQIFDDWGDDMKLAIGIESNGDYNVYPLYESWSYTTGNISKIREDLGYDTYLLQWKDSENTCDLVCLNNGEIMIESGIFVDDEHEPYIDEDDGDTVYFWEMRQGTIKKYKSSITEGSDGDAEEVPEEEEEQEDDSNATIEPKASLDFSTKGNFLDNKRHFVQAENVKKDFWNKLNKLNEIRKRDSQLRLD